MRCTRGLIPMFTLLFAGVSVAAAQAATITFDGDEYSTGDGLGSVMTILTLQARPAEAGEVGWNGASDVITGDAKTGASQSLTRSVQELFDIGVKPDGSNLVLVFNVSEPGNDLGVTVDDLTATFYGVDGSTLFTASTDQSYGLGNTTGVGKAGWLFNVAMSPEEAGQFFSNSANRIGLSTDVLSSAGAPETIFVASAGSPRIVPLPAAAWLGVVGLGAALIARRRMVCGS